MGGSRTPYSILLKNIFTMDKKIVIVIAHPDDESYGLGGTIAKYSSQGVEIHLITATNGEKAKLTDSHKINTDLGQVRKEELSEAGKILKIQRIYFLDYPDSLLDTIPINKLKSKIKSIIEKVEPQIIITCDRNGITGHPDHRYISRATSEVFYELHMEERVLKNNKRSAPFKLYYLTFPDDWFDNLPWIRKFVLRRRIKGTAADKITTEIDISPFSAIKKKACNAHKSQMDNLNRIQKYIGEKYFSKEFFILVNTSDFGLSEKQKENDLFGNLISDDQVNITNPGGYQ